MSQVVVEEIAQPAGRLELGHVSMQVETIDAPHFERHVVTDNVSDVGRHQNLLPEIPVMVLLTEDTGHRSGPTSHRRRNRRTRTFARGGSQPTRLASSPALDRALFLLGGLRRSFASSPWQKPSREPV